MATQADIMADLGMDGGQNCVSVSGSSGASLGQELGNDSTVEELWAMKAMEHSEIHFNLLCALDPKLLRLTPKDNEIYESFREEFPDFKVDKIMAEELKSSASKEKWRPFCEKFKTEVEDYSFATLVRMIADEEYIEENTILVTRIQFFCIEIARNREGHNDDIRNKFKPKPRTKKTVQES